MRWAVAHNAAAVSLVAVMVVACAGNKPSPEDESHAAFDEVRASIQTVVSDADRAERATALVDEMERNFAESAAAIDERRDTFRRLFSNYDTSQAELEQVLEAMRNSIRDNRRKFGDTRRRLADVLTADEWRALQKKRSEAISKAIAATFS